VSGKRQQIDVHRLDVDGNFSDGLRRIDVEQGARGTRMPADRGQRLNHADLVVGRHHADERRVVSDSAFEGAQINSPVSADRHDGRPPALRAQPRNQLEHRFVFDRRADDVPARSRRRVGRPADREVVGLGGAAREDNFARRRADKRRHVPARRFDRFLRAPAPLVARRRRVAERLSEIRKHGVEHPPVDGRRRVGIQVHGRVCHARQF